MFATFLMIISHGRISTFPHNEKRERSNSTLFVKRNLINEKTAPPDLH